MNNQEIAKTLEEMEKSCNYSPTFYEFIQKWLEENPNKIEKSIEDLTEQLDDILWELKDYESKMSSKQRHKVKDTLNLYLNFSEPW